MVQRFTLTRSQGSVARPDHLRPGAQLSAGEGLVTEHVRVIEVREIGKPDGSFELLKKPKHDDPEARASEAVPSPA
jgi:hypothetical protein